MSERVVCEKCGIQRPSDSPFGLCPSCLLKAGLDGVTISFGPATSSVLASFGEAFGNIPPVLLRDPDSVTHPGPIVRPTADAFADSKNRLPRLQMFGEIARGGMGAVLKGRDADLGRELAVKVLLESHKDKPEMVRRFVEEAQIAGQLQHPGIVPVYELGALGDQRPYFAMKLVKGETLAAVLSKRKPSSEGLPRLLSILESICQTMAYAHARGVIHRDLKPSNVMVGSFGEVQVMDWGLAKVLPHGGVTDDATAGRTKDEATVIATARSASDVDASLVGSIMGTPAYMAPEQARGEVDQLDQRVDVFAIGSIFCEMLTGQPAFLGRNSGEIQRKAARGDLSDALARLDALEQGYDKELTDLAKACLALEPEDRPRNAGEVAERLSDYQARVQTRLRQSEIERAEENARSIEAAKRASVEQQRLRLAVALALCVLGFVILGGSGWAYVAQQKAVRESATERKAADAMAMASLFRGQAKASQVGDQNNWNEAISAAKQAQVILQAGESNESLRGSVDELLKTLEGEKAEALRMVSENEKDQKLLTQLEAIRQKYVDAGDLRNYYGDKEKETKADEAYCDAFRAFGINVDQIDPTEAGRLFRQRSLLEEFVFSIDSWMLIRKSLANWDLEKQTEKVQRGNPNWQRLIAVAKAMDDSPWRNQLRTLIGNSDYPSVLRLAEDEQELSKQPARSLFLLALVLEDTRGRRLLWNDGPFREHSILLLKRAWRLSPNDLQICLQLAKECPDQSEKVRFATAAVAAAPKSETSRELLLDTLLPPPRADYPGAFKYEDDLFVKQGDEPNIDVTNYVAFKYKNGDTSYIGPVRLDPLTAAKKQEWSLGVDELREVIRIDPSSVDRHGRLARMLVRLDRYEEAIKECQTIAEMDPQASPASVIGHTLYGMGQLDRAKELLNKASQKDPKNFHQYALLGMIFHEQGEREAAFNAFRREMTDMADYSSRRKRIWLETTGTFDEVVAAYRSSIELHPKYHGLLEMMAEFLAHEEKTDEAIAVYRERLALYPEDEPYYVSTTTEAAANLLFNANRPDEAIELYKTTIAKHAKNIFLRKSLAGIYRKTGRSAERLAELNQLVTLYLDEMKKDKSDRLTYGLSRIYLSLGNNEQAKKYYRISLIARQDWLALNDDAMGFATDTREEQRDGELAVEAATKACELTGWGNSMVLDTLACAYAEKGDFESAVKSQMKAIELCDRDSERAAMEDNLKLLQERKPVRTNRSNN